MPFNGTVFTLPNGATNAQPGQTVQSAIWDAIHSDLNTGLTELMSQLVSVETFRNALCDNGDFTIWQRGTTISVAASTTVYTADRWYLGLGASENHTVARVSSLSNTAQYACKVQRVAGQTGVTVPLFGYPLTTDEVIRLCGSPITLSLLLQAGSTFSPANGTLAIAVIFGTGSPVKYVTGTYTNPTTIISTSVNLQASVTTAVVVTSVGAVPTNATQGEVILLWTPVGTAGVDDSFTIGDVQLEADLSSSTWTPTKYDRIPSSRQEYGCKRFYRKTFPYATAPAQSGGVTGALIWNGYTTATGLQWNLGVPALWSSPSITTYNPSGASANAQNISTAVSVAVSVDSVSSSNSPNVIWVQAGAVSAAGQQVAIHITASAGI